jgi:hypothetical protein
MHRMHVHPPSPLLNPPPPPGHVHPPPPQPERLAMRKDEAVCNKKKRKLFTCDFLKLPVVFCWHLEGQ